MMVKLRRGRDIRTPNPFSNFGKLTTFAQKQNPPYLGLSRGIEILLTTPTTLHHALCIERLEVVTTELVWNF